MLPDEQYQRAQPCSDVLVPVFGDVLSCFDSRSSASPEADCFPCRSIRTSELLLAYQVLLPGSEGVFLCFRVEEQMHTVLKAAHEEGHVNDSGSCILQLWQEHALAAFTIPVCCRFVK